MHLLKISCKEAVPSGGTNVMNRGTSKMMTRAMQMKILCRQTLRSPLVVALTPLTMSTS
jgi:hypothetical protein